MAKNAKALLAAYLSGVTAERITGAVDSTAEAAARLAATLEEPSVAARFATLGGAWNANTVALLREAAAQLHALHDRMKTEKATSNDAKVPAALVAEALALRSRLRALTEYWLSDDPVEGPELDDIRVGTGYEDLASDLVRYAAMILRHHALLATDRKHFRDEDTAEATRVARDLRAALAEGESQSAVAEELRLTFTGVRNLYGKTIAAAQFLFHGEPEASRFVSLAAELRSAAKPSKKPKTAPSA
jgi:hypothetical protein